MKVIRFDTQLPPKIVFNNIAFEYFTKKYNLTNKSKNLKKEICQLIKFVYLQLILCKTLVCVCEIRISMIYKFIVLIFIIK